MSSCPQITTSRYHTVNLTVNSTVNPTTNPTTNSTIKASRDSFHLPTSGVGKSSLVSAIFGINIQDTDIGLGHVGRADIAYEYASKNSSRFILHNSEGFGTGSAEKWDTMKNFIQETSDEKLPPKDRLHAIWLCIETPRTGMRLMQTADEQLFHLASKLKIAVIVIFTKYDLLFTEFFRMAGGKGADYCTIDTNAKAHIKKLIENHEQKFKYIITTTLTAEYLGLGNTRTMLTNVTDITQQTLLAPQSSFSLAVAREIDIDKQLKFGLEPT
ncbi:hypothetical protein DXG01_001578 [Tephrocybe rancida]|nr:hypothetical protein DXG01_001578 [Tephrocybe rancida]